MVDVMAVSKAITEAVAGFPTGQPSDSTDGQKDTPPKSAQQRSQRELRALVTKKQTTQSALTLLQSQGRPDLAASIWRRQQAEAG